ncbi:BolA-like protein 1 [Wickerhamomyces ciferrii]|uniref:BolA-like protein 1 n=1 Tax=Wickerhamomyces ciferrii (strain ATCC 14091 / BCRC 22168 / CBS 111 / JCM 3599 / NBRC 0793 / NRRL Y-1031 F-60-10) TaxID=1206466 RepID=K0KHU6_WICCF|nr:BolA-like protein 1 [Wickerhamomyces ciferrii]CCH42591.1 BolA-like protein 1 [Wickerhamomyces ciferrii]
MGQSKSRQNLNSSIPKPSSSHHSMLRPLATRIRTFATKMTTPGPIEEVITSKLQKEFNPISLKIRNDSHKHAHHRAMDDVTNRTESHFHIDIVSEKFQGKNQPSRHRLIYSLLKDEIDNKGVHAIQMKTKTPEEVNK